MQVVDFSRILGSFKKRCEPLFESPKNKSEVASGLYTAVRSGTLQEAWTVTGLVPLELSQVRVIARECAGTLIQYNTSFH